MVNVENMCGYFLSSSSDDTVVWTRTLSELLFWLFMFSRLQCPRIKTLFWVK